MGMERDRRRQGAVERVGRRAGRVAGVGEGLRLRRFVPQIAATGMQDRMRARRRGGVLGENEWTWDGREVKNAAKAATGLCHRVRVWSRGRREVWRKRSAQAPSSWLLQGLLVLLTGCCCLVAALWRHMPPVMLPR